MAINLIQNTFTRGELDPLLLSRVDYEGYYKGGRKLRNVLVIPQGGVKQRFGTKYIDTVMDRVNSIYVTDETQIMFLVFQYSREKSYLIVVRPDTASDPIVPGDATAIDIYLDGVLVKTLQAGDGVPWLVSQVDELKYVRVTDRVLMLHHDTIPQQLIRGTTDTDWTIGPQSFLYYPTYDFSIKDGGALIYTGPTVTFTPSATAGAVTVTVANAAPVTSNHVGGLYYGNGGILRITAVASTTSFSGFTLHDFANTNAIRGDLSILKEPSWGNGGGAVGTNPARGWPAIGTIFQNRLVYGNTPLLANLLSVSETFNYESFDDASADDNAGFSYLLGSDSLNEILNLVSTTSLIAITTNSVFATNTFTDTPITPANAFFNEQSRDGCNEVLAQVIDDQVLYVDDHSRSVQSMSFDIIQSRIQTTDASLLSPHLIRRPREAAIFLNPLVNDGNYYFLVNGQDGSLAVFQSLKDQDVYAWTLSTTQGAFADICADSEQCYVFVKRQSPANSGGANQYVYKAVPDFSLFTDITAECASTGSNTTLYDNVDLPDTYLVIGNSCPFTILGFNLNIGADTSILPVFEYLDKNNRWVPLDNVDDQTNGFMNSGTISWTFDDTIDWAPNTVNEIENKFWMRIQRTAPVLIVLPTEDDVFVDIGDVIFIEQIAFDYIPDCVEEATSDANGLISGLVGLNGRQVWLLQQTSKTYNVHAGVCHGPYFVEGSGIQLAPGLENLNFVIGIFAPPLIVPMPPVGQTQQGTSVYIPKYVQSVFVDYYQSAGLYVAKREIPVLRVGGFSIDIPLTLRTDFWEISPYPDRNPRVEIPITTVQPLPFTVIGIGYKVDF